MPVPIRFIGVVVVGAVLVACGDDGDRHPTDAGARTDAGRDAGMDGGTPPRDGGAADGGADFDANVPEGLCPVTLEYLETTETVRVFAAGDWNGYATDADELLDDDSDGTFTATLFLEPGLHPYKLYVRGDSAEPWRFDPANPYRAYDDGIENSGLRVDDCRRPALVVQDTSVSRPGAGDGRFDATLRYDRRVAGPLAEVRAEVRSGGTWRDLGASELTVDAPDVTVGLAGLADGKHTVRLVAVDTSGAESEAAVLPFWIEAEPFAWNDALIYMVMTDRFRNGDTTNDPAPTSASPGADYEGGDLQGVAQAIRDGYMDDLGVTALWLTPFNTNPDGVYDSADGGHGVTGYHGYWPVEPRQVDPRIGGGDALDDVVAAAHEHGIRVLMDLVLNHVHEEHPYATDHPDWFNDGCVCGTAGCDWTARRLDCLFRPYMPDVDWTNNEASEQFISDALWWMERFDLDGFRVDAVKHVVDAAVIDLAVRVRERFETASTRAFLMGETAMGWDSSSGPEEGGNVENYGTISRYIDPGGAGLDGQFDFVLYYAGSMQMLGDTAGRGMIHMDYWTRASLAEYPAGSIMTPYIGSHDTSRWITLQTDPSRAGSKWTDLPSQPSTDEPYDRMYVALAWLLAIPGAPLLYYGDEYGEYGGADPDNRHFMRFGSDLSAREQAELARVQALGTARHQLMGLRRGALRTLYTSETVWAFARGEGADAVIVVLDKGASDEPLTFSVPAGVAADGRTLTDVLGSGTTATITGGSLTVTAPARAALYLH